MGVCVSGEGAPIGKELTQESFRLRLVEPRHNLHLMIRPRIAQHITHAAASTSLWLPGSEDHPLKTRELNGAGAHRAGLERHHERATIEMRAAQLSACGAQSADFGMACRVMLGLARIDSLGDHAPTRI